ncbi:O-antigen ligase family protein [Chitinophaga sp.]|uniref:O-antigen ligase family protein n=1 Tax=Chitinophaga sp. TaxID=1869181 RepID=UPI0031D90102
MNFLFAEGIALLFMFRCLKWNGRFALTRIDVIFSLLVMYVIIRSELRLTLRLVDVMALSGCYVLLRRAPLRFFIYMFYGIVVCGIIESSYGLLQLYDVLPAEGQFKLTGHFFNLGAFAAFIACTVCISIVLLLFFKGKRYQFIPWVNVVLAVIVLPVTYNRTAWIICVVVGLFLFLSRRIWVLMIGMVILTGTYFIKKDSADGRMLIWKVTMDMIGQQPVWGVGYDRFAAKYMNYQGAYLAARGSNEERQLADNVYYAFNDLLQATAELGIIGGIGVLALLYCCFSIRRGKRLLWAGQGIVLAYVIAGLFYYPHFILSLKVVGVVGLALLSRLDKRVYQGRIPPLVLIVPAIGMIIWILPLQCGYYYWGKAKVAFGQQQIHRSLDYARKATPVMKQNGEFLSETGKSYMLVDSLDEAAAYMRQSQTYLNNTVIETNLGIISLQKKQFADAEKHYKQALCMVPNRFFTEFLLLELYTKTHEDRKACERADIILHKDMKVYSSAVREILDSAKHYYDHHCSQ